MAFVKCLFFIDISVNKLRFGSQREFYQEVFFFTNENIYKKMEQINRCIFAQFVSLSQVRMDEKQHFCYITMYKYKKTFRI